MNLLRSTAVVGSMTSISRVLGFIRDMLIAGTLGTGPIADAFFVAFRFPNLFRRFFAEGAFNAAFVPLFSRELEAHGREAAKHLAEQALAILLTSLLVLTVLAQIFMPGIIDVIAGGFRDDPEKFELTVYFTRITFPYLLFVSIVALLSGILNSLRLFALPAAAPTLLNLILIPSILYLAPLMPSVGHALVWGVVVAGWAQMIALLIGCARIGMVPRLPRPRLTPKTKRLISLGIPGVIAGGITQINLLIGSMIASFEAGAVSILQYADRIYQLPLGLIGVAMGVVLLPELSRRIGAGDEAGAMHSQNRALELSMLLTLPAAVALFAIPGPVLTVLFETMPELAIGRPSAFGTDDTMRAVPALMAFAVGLPAFVLIKVFQPGFFAREDTRTPMRFSVINVALNIALSFLLFFRWEAEQISNAFSSMGITAQVPFDIGFGMGLLGIAIATTFAAWVNTALLVTRLIQIKQFAHDARLAMRIPGILGASLGMGLVLWFGKGWTAGLMAGSQWQQVAALAVLVALGLGSFGALVQITGGAKISELKGAFVRG